MKLLWLLSKQYMMHGRLGSLPMVQPGLRHYHAVPCGRLMLGALLLLLLLLLVVVVVVG
jgi:hypothetical protein